MLVARQPIFDRTKNVIAYELLFRSSRINLYEASDGNQATSTLLIDSYLNLGIDVVTGGKKAFINFTGELLRQEVAHLLPSESVVVEILETVEPDEEILAACRKLKEAGYALALDDFVYEPRFEPLLAYADIVKIDFLNTEPAERAAIVSRSQGNPGIKFLAEKLETQAAFNEAVRLGYTYFQGYFFSKPVIIGRRRIPAATVSYMKLLQEIRATDMNVGRIEQIIKDEMSLSYRLFKYINSANFGMTREISSIRQAIALLGQQELLRWMTLNTLYLADYQKPPELLSNASIRAYFCEEIAVRLGRTGIAPDAFLAGMFSLLDAILDIPMEVLLGELPVSQAIKAALTDGTGFIGDILKMVVYYEQADWELVFMAAARLALPAGELPKLYIQALQAGCTPENGCLIRI